MLRSTGKKPSISPCKVDSEAAEDDRELWQTRAKFCEDISFWLGTFLSTIQMVDSEKLITGRSTRERLEMLNSSRIFSD